MYIYGKLNPCKMEKERVKNCFKMKTMGKSKEDAKVCSQTGLSRTLLGVWLVKLFNNLAVDIAECSAQKSGS